MAILWMDAARNNLLTATNSYADIQRQLDRYNKVFETYSHASPETQMRAASVMRQAINEYNWLKKQQEENAVRIYEAQQWVDYYNNKQTQVQQSPLVQRRVNDTLDNTVQAMPTETIPVVAISTPWKLNNNAPATNVEVNALDTNKTMNVSTLPTINPSNVNPTVPVWVSNIISSQTPKYPNTSIGPTNTVTNTINWPNYWPGSVATTPGTGNVVALSTPASLGRKSNLWKNVNNLVRKWINYLYNKLTR